MNSQTIVMCVVALILGMLLANMLKSVCGCNKVVEGVDAESCASLDAQIESIKKKKKTCTGPTCTLTCVHGSCKPNDGGGECSCHHGWGGPHCDVRTGECSCPEKPDVGTGCAGNARWCTGVSYESCLRDDFQAGGCFWNDDGSISMVNLR